MKCPEGHSLPNETGAGQCTPMYCAAPPDSSPPPEASELVPLDEREEGIDYSGKLEKRHVDKALVREAIRNKALNVPVGLKGADAEAHVDSKLAELAVQAVAVYEERLRFGNDDQRFRAARDVLAATGHGPRESGGRVGALIVIQANGAVVDGKTKPIWKRPKKAKVVEGDVVDVKALPAKKDDEDHDA